MPGARNRRPIITQLTEDQRDRLNALVDSALQGGSMRVGSVVYSELAQIAAHDPGGKWAEDAMKLLTVERLDTWAKQRQREYGTNVKIGDKTVFVSDARSHRIRVVTKDGVVFAWQQGLWWNEDWLILAQMIQIAVEQGARNDEKVAAMRRGYALKDTYPTARSAREACDQMGVTIEQFLASAP